ncbi:MAG: hypothetical protein B6D59_02030 [Campylobacteraceae bacterium 4484_4]|nr:MAG: hypothetical protein B6D59_02030 [Campylobacteraceae bacterium 4484_4]
MSDAIAKKYVKALLNVTGPKGIEGVYKKLLPLKEAYSNSKLQAILRDSEIKRGERVEFILSLIEKPDAKLTNFIKILGEHDRLEMLPAIVDEIAEEISRIKNEYTGVVLSDFKIDPKELKEIEKRLSDRLGAKIKLKNEVGAYPGVKVEIDSLGVEVGFSAERLKAQMADFILKAI